MLHSFKGSRSLEPRARQNVLLELVFFIGHLGRDKVCALKKGAVEIPSDFAGVVWEPRMIIMDGSNLFLVNSRLLVM